MADEDGILDGTVSEVKESIKDLNNPDYKELLEREEEGEDRKGVKEFLQGKIEDLKSSEEDSKEEKTEENKQIKYGIALGGLLLGLIIGMAAGSMTGGKSIDGDRKLAKDNVRELIESGGFNGTADVGEPEVKNGMYYFNVSLTAERLNGTERTRYQTAWVTKDGKLLFPENPLMGIPIRIEEAIQQQNQAPSGQPPAPEPETAP